MTDHCPILSDSATIAPLRFASLHTASTPFVLGTSFLPVRVIASLSASASALNALSALRVHTRIQCQSCALPVCMDENKAAACLHAPVVVILAA